MNWPIALSTHSNRYNFSEMAQDRVRLQQGKRYKSVPSAGENQDHSGPVALEEAQSSPGHCLGTIISSQWRGVTPYSPAPNSTAALGMALENAGGSRQPRLHVETTRIGEATSMYKVRARFCSCCARCWRETAELGAGCSAGVCTPAAATGQPGTPRTTRTWDLCALRYFSIGFFLLTESRASTESSFNKNNAMQMNLNQKN